MLQQGSLWSLWWWMLEVRRLSPWWMDLFWDIVVLYWGSTRNESSWSVHAPEGSIYPVWHPSTSLLSLVLPFLFHAEELVLYLKASSLCTNFSMKITRCRVSNCTYLCQTTHSGLFMRHWTYSVLRRSHQTQPASKCQNLGIKILFTHFLKYLLEKELYLFFSPLTEKSVQYSFSYMDVR